MRNLQLIKDPREHFAVFWKEQPQDAQARLAELQDDLRELVRQIQEGQFLSRCVTVELLPPPAADPNRELSALLSNEQQSVGSTSPQKIPGTYWIVPGDLLEVALLSCEIVGLEAQNEQQEKEHHAQVAEHKAD